MVQTAKIVLKTDSKMTGRRLCTGSCGFSGFCGWFQVHSKFLTGYKLPVQKMMIGKYVI